MRGHSRRYWRQTALAYLFILPAALILLVFHILPMFLSLGVSFLDWNLISRPEWVGLRNYMDALANPEFRHALWMTVYYVGTSVPLTLALALALAVAFQSRLRGTGLYRTAYFIPYVTAANAAAIVWFYIFYPQSGGLLNEALHAIHLPRLQWLEDPRWAMPAVVIYSLWKYVGYDAVIYLAGLQNIPREYYEAAAMDGATGWTAFRYITWPLVSPTTYFLLIISIISSFQVFSPVYIMTPDGGPLKSTTVVVYYLYQQAFNYFDFGYASALAYILFVVLFVLTLVQRRVVGKRVIYE